MPKLNQFHEVAPSDWWLVDSRQKRRSKRESVRQWLLHEIVATYGFPSDWVGRRITALPDPANPLKVNRVFGFCVRTEEGTPFLIASVASPGKARDAEEALRATMLATEAAGVGVATDGTAEGTVFLRRRFDTPKCEYTGDIETYSRSGDTPRAGPRLFQTGELKGSELKPLQHRIEDLFFELHSHIRDIDGLHADEALDELCKVLYAKLFDEEATPPDAPVRVQRRLYGSIEELAASVRWAYRKGNEYDLRVFRLKIPEYERSRGVFNKPIRLSSAALAKVVQGLQAFSLSRSSADVKGRAFQRVIGPAMRSGMGQYFTPEPVIRFMVQVLRPNHNDLILDPFCGSGHFLSQCLDYVRSHYADRDQRAFHEFAFGKLHGIEKSDRMVRIAMTDMRLHGDGHSNIRCADALLDFKNYPDLEPGSFDLILTNPPFGSLLSAEAIAQLGQFELAKGRRKVPLEIIGLERCLQFLRPDGFLGVVLPDSILSNRGTKYVRDWVTKHAQVLAVISLPIETFTPFGANIKTSVLFLRKRQYGENLGPSNRLSLVRIDSVGYDTTGRPSAESELPRAAEELTEIIDRRE